MQGMFPGSDSASLGLGAIPAGNGYVAQGVAASPAAPVANNAAMGPARTGNAAVAWGTIVVALIAVYFLFTPIKLS